MCIPKILVSLKMLSNAKIKKPIFKNNNFKRNLIKIISRVFKIWPVRINLFISKKFSEKTLDKDKILSYGMDTCYFTKFDFEDIFPLQKIKFENIEFYSPRNYDKYLRTSYGDYMKIPPKEKQQSHISYFQYK